jgi:hypothetical protein
MADPWADRIKLNPSYTPTKNAQHGMPGATQGTVGNGLNDSGSSDSAGSSDISNSFSTRACPDNPIESWGGISNPFSGDLPGTEL